MENITGIRGDGHDEERATARGGQRGCERAGRAGRQVVWSGHLRMIERIAHTSFLSPYFLQHNRAKRASQSLTASWLKDHPRTKNISDTWRTDKFKVP